MAGLNPLVKGILAVLLFGFALYFFVFSFISANNPSSNVISSTQVNSTIRVINNSLGNFNTIADNARTTLDNSEPSLTTYVFLISRAFWDIALSFLSILISGFAVIITILFPSLMGAGFSPFNVAISVINTFVLISIVFAIIKMIRTGESDR